jgi:5-methylcytosine-specific restriction protein A
MTRSAWLYTWNPDRWDWLDQQQAVYDVTNDKPYDVYWSCGNTRRIEIGDLFFLMRLGKEPKGIIGCGYVSSTPFMLPHWDPDESSAGKEAPRTDLLFKALSILPIVSLVDLESSYPDYNWTPRASGTSIPEGIAEELFRVVQGDRRFVFQPVTTEQVTLYAEGKPKLVTTKTYDRSAKARKECIKHHGYDCAVCRFNFEQKYGEVGTEYIEVHHLKQVSDVGQEYEINPVRDLRPVCSNCHRMLHKTRPPMSIEELKSRHKA